MKGKMLNMKKDFALGFIGVGNMGEAIVRGLVKDKLLDRSSIVVTDIDRAKCLKLESELGINTADNISDLLSQVDAVLYSAKPQNCPQILPQISSTIKPPQWLISIAAGVKTKIIEAYLPDETPVVRVMPSITALVGECPAAICAGKNATEKHLQMTQEIFNSVGITLIVDEKLLDAVTGLSGSGPAYVFLFIEALADAGVQVGLSRSDATHLAVQTVKGASKMIAESDEHPAILKNKVTSPGGTTAAGLYELECGNFRSAVASAVISATKRSEELSSVANNKNTSKNVKRKT